MDRSAGLTLWELLVALLVAGILLGLGAPSFGDLVLDMRRTADINAFVTAIQLARSESAKRGANVVLCKTADTRACGGGEIGYERGFMVFVNTDGDSPPSRGAGDALLFAFEPASVGTIRSNRARYEFRPFRKRSTNGTVTFCDARGPAAARAVIVSYTGRPRVSARGPGDRALVCAGTT